MALRHAPLADHLARQLGDALDVVARAGRHAVEGQLLADAAAHQDGDRRFEVLARIGVLVVDGELHGHAQRAAARDDRDLVQRVRVRRPERDQRVPGLVDRP